MINGIITKGIGGFYYVSDGNDLYECKARGKFRKQGIKPMVGDRVKISVVNSTTNEGAVEEIEERTNFLVRPPVANVECLVIVVASTNPQPDYFMIDKLSVSAKYRNIDVVIAVNKTDLMPADEIESIYKVAGFDVYSVCAETGEGVDELTKRISGKITAFAGNSGVGKSSLLNRFGLNLETGDISKILRGKHTTRHVELFQLSNNTYLMDTPGFSILEISDIESTKLKELFPEFIPYNYDCKFDNCNHFGASSSDCAVVDAVKNGLIPVSRYESYTKLYDALKEIKKWEK